MIPKSFYRKAYGYNEDHAEIIDTHNNFVLSKSNGNHYIIDDPSGDVLITIHSSTWTCSPEETKATCVKILHALE